MTGLVHKIQIRFHLVIQLLQNQKTVQIRLKPPETVSVGVSGRKSGRNLDELFCKPCGGSKLRKGETYSATVRVGARRDHLLVLRSDIIVDFNIEK